MSRDATLVVNHCTKFEVHIFTFFWVLRGSNFNFHLSNLQ